MDDYYEVLGIERGANRDEIRDAYRARRDELAGDAGARADLAELNQAWNVLADPYQRGRHDAELEARADATASTGQAGDLDGEPTGGDDGANERPKGRAVRERPPPPPPTIEIPAGLRLAETRPRVLAMLLDLTVMLLIVMGAQMIAGQVVDAQFPDEVDELERLRDEIDDVDDELDEVRDRIDDVESGIDDASDSAVAADAEGDPAALDAARAERAELQDRRESLDAAEAELEDQRDALSDEAVDVQAELLPVQLGFFAGGLAVALLYVVPSTALTGQTLGKRLRKVRVVRLDGSRPGWATAAIRFVPLVGFVGAFLFVLGQLAVVLGLVVVLVWLRNPNRQGLHDRLAKTLVVDGAPPPRPAGGTGDPDS